jgi:hypothetical protein
LKRKEPPTDPRQSLVVDGGGECAVLRRTLGATAWFVLEELAIRATANGDGKLIVQVSTRDLAEALALNKDTVTRALARLRERKHIGLVARGGSTGAARFAVHTPGLTRLTKTDLDVPTRTTNEVPARTRLQRRRGETGASQLSLLE